MIDISRFNYHYIRRQSVRRSSFFSLDVSVTNIIILMLFCKRAITCWLLVSSCEALRILVVFPLGSVSHNILGRGVVNHLLSAGHEVVHITGIPRDEQNTNLREIVYASKDVVNEEDANMPFHLNLNKLIGSINVGEKMYAFKFFFYFHKLFLEDKNITDFLSDPKEEFDAVIIDWMFSDIIAGIAPLFQCPLIWFCSTEAHWHVLKLVGYIPNPAYNVDIFSPSRAKLPLTFWQRVGELWLMIKKTVMINFIITSKEQSFYNSIFPNIASKRGVQLPSYDDAVYNGSLLLLNSHPSYGTPISLPPNTKYVGGYHIEDKIKPLPEDLQKIMDKAERGVIFFSMGSNLKSADMSVEMRKSLLQMFAKLRLTILWKFEKSLNYNYVPPNVNLLKWAPQLSILNHPNLKLFITHGGQLSTTEAVHFGVPVIGIPVFGDQYINMDTVERKGFGIKLNFTDNIAEQLFDAIKKIVSRPKYMHRAKELSQMYHDRVVPPGKELVHWVEHVVRTRGAPHLRSPALMLPWYQKIYLDLLALIVISVFVFVCIVKRLGLMLMKCTKSVNKVKKN